MARSRCAPRGPGALHGVGGLRGSCRGRAMHQHLFGRVPQRHGERGVPIQAAPSPLQGSSTGAWLGTSLQLQVGSLLAHGYTGIGISLYSSTPSRSSRMGSASSASSCGEMAAERAPRGPAITHQSIREDEGYSAGHRVGTYTLHLPVSEDAAEQAHAEWHREDEDEGEGQGGYGGHDGPEHGQARQLQPSEEMHAQCSYLHGGSHQCKSDPCIPLQPQHSSPPLGQPLRPPDLFDIGDIRVVLWGHQQQLQALVELDAIEGGDTHVEEDPKEHGQRDLPQQVPNDDGQACDRAGSATLLGPLLPAWSPAMAVLGEGPASLVPMQDRMATTLRAQGTPALLVLLPHHHSSPQLPGAPHGHTGWSRAGRGRAAVRDVLTHEHSHQQPGDPLLLHLLDLGLVPRCHSLAHDGEGVGVCDRAHGGRGEPRQPKQGEEATHGHNEQEVKVEPRALLQHPLLLADDQPGHKGRLSAWLDRAWHGTVQHGTAQQDMEWPSSAWHSTPCPIMPCAALQGPQTTPLCSRGDLGLHEDEDEDEDGGEATGHHHPYGEVTLLTQGVDHPAPLVRGCHREPAGHAQLLQEGARNSGVTHKLCPIALPQQVVLRHGMSHGGTGTCCSQAQRAPSKVGRGRQAERAGLVQPGEVSKDTLEQLPVPTGANKKAGEGLLTRAGRDRTRGNSFKLTEGRLR
uniref:Uncharacterized protein n=1 Tax=Melopsittacus undulatus TaxID=13146 RepID=A0A8V5G5U0_MELUD